MVEVPTSPPQFTCDKCHCQFFSRNKLFKHVRDSHTSPPTSTESPNSILPLVELPPHFVYVLGGRLRGRTLNAVQRFSSVRQQWEDCPAGRMIENRGSHGATTVDEVLYVVDILNAVHACCRAGGGGLHSNLSSCEKFTGVFPREVNEHNSSNSSWERVPALGVSRHALAVTSAGNSVYAVGGWIDGTLCSPAAEEYLCISSTDPTPSGPSSVRGRWVPLPPLNTARKLHGCAVLHGKLYAFGGSCDEPLWHTDTVEVLDLKAIQSEREKFRDMSSASSLISEGDEGSNAVQTKEERRGECSVGEGAEERVTVVDTRRSVAADYQGYSGAVRWEELSCRLPVRGGGCSAVTVGDRIFVFLHGSAGGVCSFDPAGEKFSALTPLPVEDWHCFDVTCVTGAEEVYVIGGASKGAWAKVAYLYHTRLDSWRRLPDMPQAKRRMAATVLMESPPPVLD